MSPDPAADARERRRRSRNVATLVVLLGLALLFFAITLVRLRHL